MKDILERTKEPNIDLKKYLRSAYIHPVFKASDEEEDDEESAINCVVDVHDEPALVPTKRHSKQTSPFTSQANNSTRFLLLHDELNRKLCV